MNNQDPSIREKVAKEEIHKLKDKQYITPATYEEVISAYESLIKDEKEWMQAKNDLESRNLQLEKQISSGTKEPTTEMSSASGPETPTLTQPNQDQSSIYKPAPKPKSAQEIRDRNITWSLSIGIILLLIGGTILATSNWDVMSNWMKTGMIAIVVVLFFGLAGFTKNVLQIKKTAMAFYVLGNLSLPIVYISLGFYEQMGSYLSFHGEGRYLYGAIGSLLLFSVYLYAAYTLKARMFVWFANVMLTLLAGFFIGWLNVPVDGFYLGIILVNTLLIAAYQYLKKKKKWQLFVEEFALYIQANLILSTLLMLVFYSSELFHGFNLILTAAVYMAMLYVTKRTEYFFVFAVMLVYGAYHVIEFSMLNNIGAVAYALLGIVFLAVPKLINNEQSLKKLFKYTSATVSAFAFIYISVQGLLVRMDEPSVTLMLAYILIAGNYIYLSNLTEVKNNIFYYLSSAFLLAALFELVRLGQTIFQYDSLAFPMFIASSVFYIVVGCLLKTSYLSVIKGSTRVMATFVMSICFLPEIALMHWVNLGVMLLITSALAIVMNSFEKRLFNRNTDVAYYLQPIALGLSVTMFYMAAQSENLQDFYSGPFEPVPLVFASLTILLTSVIWKQLKRKKFSHSSFYVAQGFYLYAMLRIFSVVNLDFNPSLRYIIVFGGIIMAYLLYRKVKSAIIPYVMGFLTLVFYITVLYALYQYNTITSELFISLQFPIGAILLFAVGTGFWKFDKLIAKAYWSVAHVYYPFAFILSLFYGDIAVWSTILAVGIYGISTWYAGNEWLRKVFLYTGFTSFWLMIVYTMLSLNMDYDLHYSWLVTTILLTIGWLLSNTSWKQRIVYYTIPFSVVGLANFAMLYPFDLPLLIVTLLYTSIILGLLHMQKWDILNGIPLLIGFMALIRFIQFHPEIDYIFMLLFAVVFMALGFLLYPVIYKEEKGKLPILDWYTVAGFISLGFLYIYADDTLFQKLLPGILVSLAVYIQKKRLPFIEGKWVFAIAISYLLQPYYTLLWNIDIPPLVEAECYVLPWVGLAIFIKFIAGEKHRAFMNYVQWAVLVVVSLILIQDGLQSNTVYDAIILGTLSLIAMLGGMFFRQKSFFFAGAGVLLLNLFIQTRPFWGEMPWWAYLLIAGSILITVASYYEWHKQKTSKGKDTFITLFYKKVVQRIKSWQ